MTNVFVLRTQLNLSVKIITLINYVWMYASVIMFTCLPNSYYTNIEISEFTENTIA